MRIPPAALIAAVVVLGVLTGALTDAAGPSTPVKLAPAEAAAAARAIEKDRADADAWLKSDPTSYLATIDRRDFLDRKTLTVGRASDNDVRIESPEVQPHHLKVTVAGDRFQVEAVDPAATFRATVKGSGPTAGGAAGNVSSQAAEQALRTAVVDPGNVRVGRFLIRLSHQRFPAIIVFDPQSPHFKAYKGLKYFKPDLAYRFVLPLTPNPKNDIVTVMSTRGNQRRAQRVGWFDFVVDGKPVRLEAVRLLEPGVDEQGVSVFFRDATSGHETYGLGRYVDASPVKGDAQGRYLLDFNLAYNPACAFSDHYNCPIPSRANTLGVAIRAGEMDARYHASPSVGGSGR